MEGFVNISAALSPGIYALVYRGEVVYIGQSKRPITRIATHRSNRGQPLPSWFPPSARGITFDEVHVLPCRVEDLNRVEAAMINLYKPRYNIRLKTPDPVEIAHLFSSPKPPPIVRRL